jgi:hypothetical protein
VDAHGEMSAVLFCAGTVLAAIASASETATHAVAKDGRGEIAVLAGLGDIDPDLLERAVLGRHEGLIDGVEAEIADPTIGPLLAARNGGVDGAAGRRGVRAGLDGESEGALVRACKRCVSRGCASSAGRDAQSSDWMLPSELKASDWKR